MKRDLERIEIPGEHDARVRAWRTIEAAFAQRERVTWPRRHARTLAFSAAAVAVVAAAVTPPGRSVVNSVRDAVGREKVVGVRPAHRELVRLPAPGRLLVVSPAGTWVFSGSSRRNLGPYRMAAWSPHGKYIAAVKDFEVYAIDPHAKGAVRWSQGFKRGPVVFPRWSYEGYRIAYFAGDVLNVTTGDGKQNWTLGNGEPRVAPAWRPGTHVVAYVGVGGDARVADADAKRVLWRARAGPDGIRALAWSDDGERLLVLGNGSVRVYDGAGHELGGSPTKGPSVAAAWQPHSQRFALVVAQVVVLVDGDTVRFPNRPLFTGTSRLGALAWSPDGKWLLVAWPRADQFVFVRVGAHPKLYAVSNVSRQFDPGVRVPRFPNVAGWSR